MEHDLLHIQGKPYVLVPLHEYRAKFSVTIANNENDLPDSLMDEIVAGEQTAIKIVRKHRGLTQQQLADKAGISRPYLTEIETGKKEGSIHSLKLIARALNVPANVLVA